MAPRACEKMNQALGDLYGEWDESAEGLKLRGSVADQLRMTPTFEITNSAASTHFSAEKAKRLPGLKPRVRKGRCKRQMRLCIASEQTSLYETQSQFASLASLTSTNAPLPLQVRPRAFTLRVLRRDLGKKVAVLAVELEDGVVAEGRSGGDELVEDFARSASRGSQQLITEAGASSSLKANLALEVVESTVGDDGARLLVDPPFGRRKLVEIDVGDCGGGHLVNMNHL